MESSRTYRKHLCVRTTTVQYRGYVLGFRNGGYGYNCKSGHNKRSGEVEGTWHCVTTLIFPWLIKLTQECDILMCKSTTNGQVTFLAFLI